MQPGCLPEELAAGFWRLDLLRPRESHRVLGVCETGAKSLCSPREAGEGKAQATGGQLLEVPHLCSWVTCPWS